MKQMILIPRHKIALVIFIFGLLLVFSSIGYNVGFNSGAMTSCECINENGYIDMSEKSITEILKEEKIWQNSSSTNS